LKRAERVDNAARIDVRMAKVSTSVAPVVDVHKYDKKLAADHNYTKKRFSKFNYTLFQDYDEELIRHKNEEVEWDAKETMIRFRNFLHAVWGLE